MSKRAISTPTKQKQLLGPRYLSIKFNYAKQLANKHQQQHESRIQTRNLENVATTHFPLSSLTCWEINGRPTVSEPSTDVYRMCTMCSNFISAKLRAKAGAKITSHVDNHPISNLSSIPKAYRCCTLWVPYDYYLSRGELDNDDLDLVDDRKKKAKVTPSPASILQGNHRSHSVTLDEDDDEDYSDCSSFQSSQSPLYYDDDDSCCSETSEPFHIFQPRVWSEDGDITHVTTSIKTSTTASPPRLRSQSEFLRSTVVNLKSVVSNLKEQAELSHLNFENKLTAILHLHKAEIAKRDAVILSAQSALQQQSDGAAASYNTLFLEKEAAYNKGVSDTMFLHNDNHKKTVHVPDSLDATKIGMAIEEMCSKIGEGRHHKRTKAKAVAKAALFHTFGGACQPLIVDYSSQILEKENPYRRPQEIARVMDTEPGALNLSGYHSLREGMEVRNEKGKIPYGGGMLASVHAVKKAMYKIEDAAQNVIPYHMLDADVADGFEFENHSTFLYLVNLLKLREPALDPAQPSVQWAFTLDGVKVSRNISIIIAGVKATDARAVNPKTGNLVEHFQSPYLCFPLKAVVMDDSKAAYDEQFSEFFSFFKNVEEFGIADYPPGAFCFASPQDGKSLWQSLKRGGACKNATYFCHCCACTSDHCFRPKVKNLRCLRCRDTDRDKCFHWRVGDAETLQRTQIEMNGMEATYPYLANPVEALNSVAGLRGIRLDDTEVEKERVPSNLCFVPADSREKQLFNNRVNRALQKMNSRIHGTLEERVQHLRAILEVCHHYKGLAEVAECCQYAGALITIRQAIPCILHLENRVGEKIVRTAILHAISRKNMTEEQQLEIINNFQHAVNTQVLGSPSRSASWRLPTTKDASNKRIIADMTMTNQHVRKFMYKFNNLSSVLFPSEEDADVKGEWDTCIESWINLMEAARQKEDFSDEDILNFQFLCDEFTEQWYGLIPGNEGVTNYIHMIAAGHLTYYLKEWKNLYRFSQQGWEGLNSIIKQFLHGRTQGGGYSGNAERRTSKVEPIARWCQRRLFFLSGDYKQHT